MQASKGWCKVSGGLDFTALADRIELHRGSKKKAQLHIEGHPNIFHQKHIQVNEPFYQLKPSCSTSYVSAMHRGKRITIYCLGVVALMPEMTHKQVGV